MTRFSIHALVLFSSILFGLVVLISTQAGVAPNIKSTSTILSFFSLVLIVYLASRKSIRTFTSVVLVLLALVDIWWPAVRAWSMRDVAQYVIEMGYNKPCSKLLSYQFLVGLNFFACLLILWAKARR